MPPETFVLAFDTSAQHCAVALVRGAATLAETTEPMVRGQAERLFPMIEDLLLSAGVTWPEIGTIGVGTGPGNFTGIRISVSAARGLALALGIPAIGVTTFEALAEGIERPVLASVDARRDESYLQMLNEPEPAISAVVSNPDLAEPFRVGTHLRCVGFDNERLAEKTGGRAVDPGVSLPVAIARIAAGRAGRPQPRPAPFYLRKADAAPSRIPPPRILS